MKDITIEKVAFETPVDRGFSAKATYLSEPKGSALIEIFRAGTLLREFIFPAYKIWNIAAHFGEIVDSEIAENVQGYDNAAWTGFSNQLVCNSCHLAKADVKVCDDPYSKEVNGTVVETQLCDECYSVRLLEV